MTEEKEKREKKRESQIPQDDPHAEATELYTAKITPSRVSVNYSSLVQYNYLYNSHKIPTKDLHHHS
jgi:hypothetical protein